MHAEASINSYSSYIYDVESICVCENFPQGRDLCTAGRSTTAIGKELDASANIRKQNI